MVAVVIVSALPTVRAGLVSLLATAGDLDVAGEARSLDGLDLATGAPDADVVLLDLAASGDLDDAVAPVERADLALVVLGPPAGAERMLLAPPGVAWGYLPREAPADRIVATIRAVAAGLVVFDPDLVPGGAPSRPPLPLPLGDEPDDLTAREREVLELVALGLTNKAVALRLGVSDHTVKFHVASILAKLGAESRTEAVHLAARRGLLTL